MLDLSKTKDELRIVGNYLEIRKFWTNISFYTEVLKLHNIEQIEYCKDEKHLVLNCKTFNKNHLFNKININPDNYEEAYNLIINALGTLNSKIPPIVPDDYETKSM